MLGACIFSSFSQEKTDSLYNPVNQFFAKRLFEAYQANATNLAHLPLKDFTASSIFLNHDEGTFQDGRTPENITEFGVHTSGLYRSKNNLLFFGNLSFKKSYYKNLKWNLSYQLPYRGLMQDPHYFGVSKGASWNNQNYDLNGGMLLPLNSKLNLLLETDYHLFNKYRTNLDPRAQLTSNALNFKAGLSYQVHPAHALNASFNYGYQHIDNDINYSNREQNIPANYDIYVKWISGLGSTSSPFNNTTKRRSTNYQARIGHLYKTNALQIATDFNYKKTELITYRNNGVEDTDDPSEYFATYTPKTYELRSTALLHLNTEKKMLLELNAVHTTADNFWQSKGGKTYAAATTSAKGSFHMLRSNSKNDFWDYGGDLEWWHVDQNDALAATSLEYTYLEIGGYLLRSFELSNQTALAPYIKPNLQLNLNSAYFQGNAGDLIDLAENDFAGLTQKALYDEVIHPNAEYYGINKAGITLGLQSKFNQAKDYQLNWDLQGSFYAPLESTLYFKNENRFSFSTSLTLSY